MAIGAGSALLFLTASGRSAQAPPGPQQNPVPPRQSAPAPPPPSSAVPVKVKTRLITIDVVATDSHGNPVRDLKQDEFQVADEHAGEQKIARFEFIDAATRAAAAAQPGPLPTGAHIFSNFETAQLKVPPTVILLDALNTDINLQSQVHRHMVMLLKTLPTDTPIAVITMGHELHVVQNFTTDPALLRVAVDRSLRALSVPGNPQDDSTSASSQVLAANGGEVTQQVQAIQDFENTMYQEQTTVRVDETVDAMLSLAKFLGGYAGRKNLVWLSSAFPSWIAPQGSPTKIPGQEFMASADYSGKIDQASQALADARVAVYPVDARGLETSPIYSTAQNPQMPRQNLGASLGGQISRQEGETIDSQATMKEIAEGTGGRPCFNTNDLSGCVQSAINDGSSYYEISYYPENIDWNGHFQKVTLKTTRHGVRLAYRRGFFASDETQAGRKPPDQLLKEACMGALPSTGISMTVEPVGGPEQASTASPGVRYLIAVSPRSLSLAPALTEGGPRKLSLRMAVCEYDPQGKSFSFFPRDLSLQVTDTVWNGLQEHGVRNIFDYGAKPDDNRLRFAVLDVPSGATGSVDVPAHPRDFGTLPSEANVTSIGPAGMAPGLAGTPASPPQAAAQREVITALTFRSSSGKTGKLDWSSGTVTYEGDLGIELGASGFFQKYFGAQYHCQAGNLVSNDPNSTTPPRLGLVLQGASGASVLVDFTGTEPQYTGQLPVGPDARPFFEQVWKLCHCQAQ